MIVYDVLVYIVRVGVYMSSDSRARLPVRHSMVVGKGSLQVYTKPSSTRSCMMCANMMCACV